MDFGRDVTILDGRTEVIVRAIDHDDNQVTERFFVDGSTRETFLDRETGDNGDPTDNDTDGGAGTDNDTVETQYPVVTVTPLQDDRRGRASSGVTVERAPVGTVGVPSEDGANAVASTGTVTLDSMTLSVANETSLTGTVVVRDRDADTLRGPTDVRPAATVSIRHSVPADRVDGLSLDLVLDRSYLDARDVDHENLTVYRSSEGAEWQEIETTVVSSDDETVRFNVESPGLSVFSLAPTITANNRTDGAGNGTAGGNETAGNGSGESGEAQIFVTNVTVNRTAVAINESVTVNATLRNNGDVNGTYKALLQTVQEGNRTQAGTATVEVPPGEERTVRYDTAFAEPGNHTISVNGSRAGPVVVGEGGGGLLSVFAFIPLRLVGLILGAIVGLLVVLTLVRFVLRRVGSGGETGG